MTEEDEAFNEIERQAKQRKESVMATVHTLTEYQRGYENGFIDGVQKQTQSDVTRIMNGGIRSDTIKEVLQLIKELRPAVLPLEGMGRGKATQEWFDILVKHIQEMKIPDYKKPWVGLTYEEESELIRLAHNHAGIRFYIQAAEAKLKEKNT